MSFNEQIQDILRRIVELEKVHTRYTGPPGRAATIRVGSVSTVPAGTPASVVNVGTPNATILNFAIPQGEDSTELNTLREERNDFRRAPTPRSRCCTRIGSASTAVCASD